MKHLLLALMAIATLTASAEGYENLKVNGTNRRMVVHTPAGLQPNAPLVISFHGAYGTGEGQQKDTRWDAVADTAKFVVVYPDGINNWWDVYGDSDLKFVEAIIDAMADKYDIDRTRVYASGFSLGSMFTYHCAEHLAHKIAAFGPVSGVRFDAKAPASTRRVPIIHTHGTNDDVFKWEGDPQHMAGGYPAISQYVKSWAMYDGLNPVAEVTDPYRNCTRTVWSDDDSMIEVELLAVKGVGHWHSEGSDWGDISTSREIWRFVKRYSLEPEPAAPKLLSIEPEDRSFDLLPSSTSFVLTWDIDIDSPKAKAVLSNGTQTITLDKSEDANSSTLTFTIPAGTSIADGEYQLTVSDIQNPEGGKVKKHTFDYTFGITEVGDKAAVDTIFSQDWEGMRDLIGEGIPTGWQRVNSSSNGSKDSQQSGAANVTGARMKYFAPGGDFNAGFYLCAREYDVCELKYGSLSTNPLSLDAGQYDILFKSTYWNAGAETTNATFNMTVGKRSATEDFLLEVKGIESTGCLNELTDSPVTGSQQHEYTFTIPAKSKYAMRFTISEGWNAVILADVTITTHQTVADKYKGGLHRMLIEANAVYDSADAAIRDAEALVALKGCIDTYSALQSTAPSVYAAAMDELSAAIEAARKAITTGIADMIYRGEPASTEYYGIDGSKVGDGYRGFVIKRDIYPDGQASVSKIQIK